jgi:hypothetical protein
MHAPFVKPTTVANVSFHMIVAARPVGSHVLFDTSSDTITGVVSHAPPIFSPPTISQLRI